MMPEKNLVVVSAHIDDLEFSAMAYLLKNASKYESIKLITATSWPIKKNIFKKNLTSIVNKLGHKNLQYVNLGFEQRVLHTRYDEVRDRIYEEINFDSKFDILTHDKNDAHSDHRALNEIMFGLYKHANGFITFYSPSSVNFFPNYYVPMSKEDFEWKESLLLEYDINNEQSYTKKGNYFRRKYINIASMYMTENFVNNDVEYGETYKIYKWMENYE